MRGDQLARQWRIIRAIQASRNGLTAAEVAQREEIGFRTIYCDLEALQAGGFPLYTQKVEKANRWAFIDTFKFKIPPIVSRKPQSSQSKNPRGFSPYFLCIHPFRDGNGRVSRLLLLLQGYYLGYEVGRYISLERLIEQNKERYYETLEQSSRGWHGGKHDPWPYITYLLYILKAAYREFEERVGQIASPRGAKTEFIVGAIGRHPGSFRIADIHTECPGVSLDMIRSVLKKFRREGKVKCLGRGQNAEWQKTGKWGGWAVE